MNKNTPRDVISKDALQFESLILLVIKTYF